MQSDKISISNCLQRDKIDKTFSWIGYVTLLVYTSWRPRMHMSINESIKKDLHVFNA